MTFFFFSSRRRHTRWPRDWSSDVCSSDLEGVLIQVAHVGEEAHPDLALGALVESESNVGLVLGQLRLLRRDGLGLRPGAHDEDGAASVGHPDALVVVAPGL